MNHPEIADERTTLTFRNKPRLLGHRAEIVVPVDVVAPPRWEGNCGATGAEDGEGQDEEHRQTGSVPGASDQVRVVLEDARAVVAEVELGEESSDDLAEDDASLRLVVWDVAGVLDELREVDLRESEAFDLGDKLRALKVNKGKEEFGYRQGGKEDALT